MTTNSAGRTHSIRLPDGLAEEVRAASGLSLSEVCRKLLQSYVASRRIERDRQES